MTTEYLQGVIDRVSVQRKREEYPDPSPEMLNGDPLFDAIWKAIKGWDISRHNDGLYSGPTGNDARHIYDAITRAQGATPSAPAASTRDQ
jgi:hypothetical protein